jgi:hypothetical protein
MIPEPLYYIDANCSWDRSIMSNISIGWIRRLLKLSGCKIVTNSMHNYMNTGKDNLSMTGGNAVERDLKQDLIRHGIPYDAFHDHWRTEFPNPRERKFSMSDPARRMLSIENWLADNGEADWLCFDDEPFTEDDRLIVIDFDRGVDKFAYRRACETWNLDPNHLSL